MKSRMCLKKSLQHGTSFAARRLKLRLLNRQRRKFRGFPIPDYLKKGNVLRKISISCDKLVVVVEYRDVFIIGETLHPCALSEWGFIEQY